MNERKGQEGEKNKKNPDLKIKMNPLLAHTSHHTPLDGIIYLKV